MAYDPADPSENGEFTLFDRASWAQLRDAVPLLIDEAGLSATRGAGDPTALAEVEDIYLPLTRLINLHVNAARRKAQVVNEFLGLPETRRPYVIAIAGSVAVGKSTMARLLQLLLSKWADHPIVDLVTSDGFLYPKERLEASGLMNRKGFPVSYDLRRMINFLASVRATGQGTAPLYSHESYDVVPGAFHHVENPDILIFEGLNVLQIGVGFRGKSPPAFTASDFFDLAIYVDAEPQIIENWYLERFNLLLATAFQSPSSYFHHLALAPASDAAVFARRIWSEINLPNLLDNILPTRGRADVIIHKGPDHAADLLLLRRI